MSSLIPEYFLKRQKRILLLFTLIFPLGGMFYAFSHKNIRWMKNIFWLVCSYTGLVFIYNPIGGINNDYIRYAQDFQNIAEMNLSFYTIISQSFTSGLFKDLFLPLFMYFLSFVTNDPGIFFFGFASIFGFFYSRNLWFIFEKLPQNINIYISIILLFYILILPFWGLVRIWLSIHIFVYGAMPFIYNKDKSKIIWVFASVLVHYAVLFPVVVFIFYYFIPKKLNLFFIIFTISLFIREIDLTLVRNIVSAYFPFMKDAAEVYTNPEYAEIRKRVQHVWHVNLSSSLNYYGVVSLIFLTYLNIKTYHLNNQSLLNLFSFALFIYSLSNIFALVPSGGRFIYLSQMFMFPAIILSFTHIDRGTKFQKYLPLSLLLVFPVIFKIRVGFDYYGLSLFFGNFFTASFWNDNIRLIDLIK